MSYKAIACKLTNVKKHPNADKLLLATVQGYQIVVGLSAKDGDLGVFFPCDGALSKEHLLVNKLYTTNPDTGEKMGGYFGSNGRVRAQRFRGQISDGFWQEQSAFTWCGGLKLKDGTEFDTLNGHRICEKYFTPATKKAMNRVQNKKVTVKVTYPLFQEHYDTQQLRHNVNAIPAGSVIYVSEKMHGTSGRTSLTLPATRRGKLANFFRKLLGLAEQWIYVSGTRRVILRRGRDGYYGSDTFRQRVHNQIAQIGLNKGETVYYEIVGFTDEGRSLMPIYPMTDEKVKKRYSDKMCFSYGCGQGESAFYVYRITQLTSDNKVIDLSWDQMLARCQQLGLKTVVELDRFVYDGNTETLLVRVNKHTLGDSTFSKDHIREGVVCRIEHQEIYTNLKHLCALKYKSFHFCEMEGIKKNDENYVDVEEIA